MYKIIEFSSTVETVLTYNINDWFMRHRNMVRLIDVSVVYEPLFHKYHAFVTYAEENNR